MTNKLKLSNLDKVYWPEKNITKGELLDYYKEVAPFILPHLQDRPISLNRFPNGYKGPSFYQKNYTSEQPEFLKSVKVKGDEKTINYLLCQNLDSLLFIVNLGSIEINPWLSTINNLDKPSFCVLDLDPVEIGFKAVCEVALEIEGMFEELNIFSLPKTSGASGLHIYIPIGNKYSYEESKNFGKILATMIARRMPEVASVERLTAKRQRKVYVDFLQNNKGQTLASAYSVRPVKEATVSTPLEWKELSKCKLRPSDFPMEETLYRAQKLGDLFLPVLQRENNILEIVQKLSS